MTPRRNAITVLAFVFLGLVCLGVVWFSDRINDLHDQEPTWVVASYSEPWRSLLAIVVLSVGFVLVSRARLRNRTRVGVVSWFALIAGLGLLTSLELGSAIFYDAITGRIYVGTLLGRRVDIDLPSNEDGVCVRAELGGVHWSVNGKEFYPRLLPLPLSSEKLEAVLLRPPPPDCGR